ncbi:MULTISPECIES: 2-amino-4-hydroxy-6-hydroxymethyldihydropteridine diphosphokinase [Lacticaseibacillus]|uniref:2-amino-4-hydroxy-6-hydroxymethyldihydropteridine diphosphokinase n=1 Tax=Lacticaseibacillus zeae subsp. silagei TaxID=3068307 RepID=A0ABD7Z6W7_LACZE|nr:MULTISPECIES: 2-amino-4-hydroxy-6-hydroxymethyldihydropteridine diphosphokinase [Lacticaseibacillus]OFS00533.1 2-amino-4-hydroxy-6-hydroxymethyldihydropteridine pyrophosphokinase [Lactobacillus sp. HMSC068F07]MDE3282834.1 2-amino-4-hydroxy-6-hydroxymethyldihydropteridine diphosphokinase [Lacticaseibacillus casei]MDE3315634.1 2-amino-4-hydroxy-6-hydroxymethyldihydropteridine diphosphokinase [Lacticaseibacillus zeae]WLV82693.1 2-amino-4-hydroxy-6-hydroxymethyldihydropteridine diphosphokinase [
MSAGFKHTAFIGIGSNLGDSLQTVKAAVDVIDADPQIEVTGSSSWYDTSPVGYEAQANFVNGVIKIKTSYTPIELLNALNQIEKRFKRKRTIHWGPRTLDLDIELYDEETIRTSRLEIPHHEMFNRLFVLKPLEEVFDGNNEMVLRIHDAITKIQGTQQIRKIEN